MHTIFIHPLEKQITVTADDYQLQKIQTETLKRIALDTNLAKIFEFDQVLGLAFLHLDKPLKLLHEIKQQQ